MMGDGSEQEGCPYCGDTDAPATSHYPPFCPLYHKEQWQQKNLTEHTDADQDGGLR
jgi:hypothetical protein